MTDEQPYVIEVGPQNQAEPVEVNPILIGEVTQVPGYFGARVLDELADVEGASTALTGEILTRKSNGRWGPGQGGGGGGTGGPLASYYEQVSPSTVWLVEHGLPFQPSGIEVIDHVGERHVPLVSRPDSQTVRFDFDYPVRGTARLS